MMREAEPGIRPTCDDSDVTWEDSSSIRFLAFFSSPRAKSAALSVLPAASRRCASWTGKHVVSNYII